jgi:hypothetical protein
MKQIVIAAALMLGLAARAEAQMGPVSRADYEAGSKAQFAQADANHDGIVTKDELTAAIAKAMGGPPPQQMVDSIFHLIDTDGDGKATAAEADAADMARFDKWDTNHDGTLTPEEAQAGRAALMAEMQKPQ